MKTDIDNQEYQETSNWWLWLMAAIIFFIIAMIIFSAIYGRESIQEIVPFILVVFASFGVASILGLGTGFLRLHSEDNFDIQSGYSSSQRVDLAAIFDDVPDPIAITNSQSQVIYANLGYKNLCPKENISTGMVSQLPNLETLFSITPEATEAINRLIRIVSSQRAGREEISFTVPNIGQKSITLYYRIQGVPLGPANKPAEVLWIVSDTTREKQRDEGLFNELKASIDTLDHAPIGFFACDHKGKITFANSTLADWLDLDFVKVFSGAYKLQDLLAGDSAALIFAIQPEPGTVRSETIDVDMLNSAGERIPVRLLYKLAVGADNNKGIARVVVIDRRVGADVVDDARTAELRFARFFHNAPIAVATIDDLGNLSRHNAAYARLVSSIKPQILTHDHKLSMLVVEKDRMSLQALIGRVRRNESDVEPLELTLVGENLRFARFFIAPVNMEGSAGEAAIVYIIETTEQKALELQFAQSQKMQAIGQLAGGIAHDFNNVLTAIIGFSDLLLSNHRATDPAFQDIMNIKQNANRAAGLVRQLLAFSRKQTLRPEVLNLSDVLSDLKIMLNRLLGEKINFKMVHGRDLWNVLADTGQFEQVIVNLCVNARDALPNGGELTLRTANITAREVKELHYRGMPIGDYVLVEVVDTGIGIPPDIIDKIFEPFFSTKDVGKGTGLGLSTVYGIVKQTGGFIYCESELNVGTTFKIYLPRHILTENEIAQRVIENTAQTTQALLPARDLTGQGKILLVEDEDPVRAFAERALTSRGYTVFAASNGSDAIEIMRENLEDIQLIVSDVVMPEMDGPTLLKELKNMKPEVRVIFMSGYAEEAFRKSLDPSIDFEFLPKPFTLKQLAETVKSVIEAHNG